jgi:transcriptional regulator GlxA family with amidase domain
MARRPALKPRSIGVLAFEDFQLLDAAGPIGASEMPMRAIQPPPCSLQVIAPTAGAIGSSSGALWMADAMARQPDDDTVVITGGSGARAAMLEPKVQAFVHAFLAETGITPAKAVERLRLASARERAEHSAGPIDVVARRVGFGDPQAHAPRLRATAAGAEADGAHVTPAC